MFVNPVLICHNIYSENKLQFAGSKEIKSSYTKTSEPTKKSQISTTIKPKKSLESIPEKRLKMAKGFLKSGKKSFLTDKNYDMAIASFSMAIQWGTLNGERLYAEPFYWRGYTKLTLEDYYAAIEDFNKAIELDPTNSESYELRGSSKSRLNDNYGAIKDFNIAIKLNPNNEWAYLSRGTTKIFLKDFKNGCEDIRKAAYMGNKRAQEMLTEDYFKNICNNY